ncbi:TPA: hypothetical protein ACNVXO_006180 [Pseudomonas aeruginosa]|jgi:hypothetical protein|nr:MULTISPECIES: hypothetical protein [Pseudomonadaceae]ATE47517.1 hypothetical protein [Pseudomonas aeruginosa]AZZ88782.1 Hypothetical protein [Pseudomonas putida]EKL8567304.1 hypothetical protein [Pseudomonas aeruginosa]EKX3886501.1 hypothetical protein [Pseudomonas aeruginosa]ELY8031247.1 hypothetical protein [Pseudomonas aeruginosa]
MLTPTEEKGVLDYLACLEWVASAEVAEIRQRLETATGQVREDLVTAIKQQMGGGRPELAWYFHHLASEKI